MSEKIPINKGRGGTLPDPKTGFIIDYANVWFDKVAALNSLNRAKNNKKRIDEIINMFKKPIPHYETYLNKTYPWWADNILKKGNKLSIQKMNLLVDEYNTKLSSNHLDESTLLEYYVPAIKLIYGKETKTLPLSND